MPEELSQMIIESLCDHKGFMNWWFDLEDEDQEEILEDLQEIIGEWMDEQ